ncbi:helix-turn-helix transcriptional regulator [Rubrivivax gelatinosus]|uniref:helix-turn-helix transcriptional regulator n=1 Tax=Rubrivivax gelatinosus TaxID=28068 RepID=UPI0014043F50|nr:autoinducer binding domain-containing protein [Rubrivivax gelatinosus]
MAPVPTVWDTVARLHESTDEADVVQLLSQVASQLSADAACFIGSVRVSASRRAQRLIAACDPAWASDYLFRQRFEHDPWLLHARRGTDPVLGSAIPADSVDQQDTVAAAHAAGLRSTWVIPAISSVGEDRIGVLYLASGVVGRLEQDPLLAFRMKVVGRSLAMELHEWLHVQMRRDLLAESRLTEAEIDLLRHEEQGHGSKAIAIALNTEAKTVDCRFQRIIAKLRVASRREAWRIAKVHGLI